MDTKITIGGREIPMRFRMDQFAEAEETVGNMGKITELIIEGKRRVRNVVSLIRIMGNAGLKKAGEKPDLTDEWLMENMEPHRLKDYQEAVINCLKAEEQSEAKTEMNENEERDLVLEEIEQKKDPVNSHTGE